MPTLFASPQQTIRPGRTPQIRGSYQRYSAPSFPPGSPVPGVRGSYQRYSSPSFPPGSPVPMGATSTRTKCSPPTGASSHAAARVMASPGVHGGFQRIAYNAPPYFSGLGATNTSDIVSQVTDWISQNPLLATGGALALGAVLLGGTSRRRR